jgi:hypothetical protein
MEGRELQILVVDTLTAYSGWWPTIPGTAEQEYPAFWNYGANSSAVVFGP